MRASRWLVGLTVLAICVAAGNHLLTAQEPVLRGSRATPRQIREANSDRPNIAAAVPHTMGRHIQDLRLLADDLETAGHKSDAIRLRTAIKEIIRRADMELAEKKAQVARLNEEIDDLKWATSQ